MLNILVFLHNTESTSFPFPGGSILQLRISGWIPLWRKYFILFFLHFQNKCLRIQCTYIFWEQQNFSFQLSALLFLKMRKFSWNWSGVINVIFRFVEFQKNFYHFLPCPKLILVYIFKCIYLQSTDRIYGRRSTNLVMKGEEK